MSLSIIINNYISTSRWAWPANLNYKKISFKNYSFVRSFKVLWDQCFLLHWNFLPNSKIRIQFHPTGDEKVLFFQGAPFHYSEFLRQSSSLLPAHCAGWEAGGMRHRVLSISVVCCQSGSQDLAMFLTLVLLLSAVVPSLLENSVPLVSVTVPGEIPLSSSG